MNAETKKRMIDYLVVIRKFGIDEAIEMVKDFENYRLLEGFDREDSENKNMEESEHIST